MPVARCSEGRYSPASLLTALNTTGLGKYLQPSLSFLSMSKRSIYVDHINPEHEELRTHIKPGRGKYIFVYPFVKTREWYLLHQQTRQGIMKEHIEIGVKYPGSAARVRDAAQRESKKLQC